MPNHITSRLTIKGVPEQVEEIVEKFGTVVESEVRKTYDNTIICRPKIKNEEGFNVGWFDTKNAEFKTRIHGKGFNDYETSIGLPEDWEFELTPHYIQFPDFKKILPPPDNIFNGSLGREEEEMCRREGRPTWYDWNRENWGTKWNSYENDKISWNVFEFQTAWSGVPELMLKMSEQCKDVEFEYMYADEDSGSNTGKMRIKNGEILESIFPESQSVEGYEIYFEIHPDYRNDYKLNENGVYVYNDDE